MAIAAPHDLAAYCLATAQRARAAAEELALVPGEVKNAWLRLSAQRLRRQSTDIVAANALDLAAAADYGLSPAQVDRLKLTPATVQSMAVALEEIAAQSDPVGEVIESSIRPNGLEVSKVRVPLGVVFFIYESRPNVTTDAAAVCIKSGNAVILRGGKEAAHSNAVLADLLRETAVECGLPVDAVQLVGLADREAVGHFLRLPEYIDVAIPRGGEGLIRRVAEEARMPVIKHFAGNCHVYLDASADPDVAERVTVNAKCHRLGVCNAAESLIVHADVAASLLPRVARALMERGIEIRAMRGFAGWFRRPSRRPRKTTRRNIWPRSSRRRWSIRWTRRFATSSVTDRSIPRRSSPATWPPPASSSAGWTVRR